MWPFRKKVEEKRRLVGIVETGSTDGQKGAVLVSSSDEHAAAGYGSIRKSLEAAHMIEGTVNPATAALVSTTFLGGTYPEDFGDFKDYRDAYQYIPFVHKAVTVKHSMVWQMGYDLECADKSSMEKVAAFLTQLQADTVFRGGSLLALIFGTMYWQKQGSGDGLVLRPLNPARVGLKLDAGDKIVQYVYEPKYGKKETIPAAEIITLKLDEDPVGLFGTSMLQNVLPTVKALLFMEEKLPLIARRRADPLLAIQIGDPTNPVDEPTFKKQKQGVLNRQPGEDIFHDGVLKIQEVYQSASIGGRQTIEPLLLHFRENLVAGLGVPDVAMGFGGTTTMATAQYQEGMLEAETRDIQRVLKRFFEGVIFPLANASKPVKLSWKPLKEADKFDLSNKLNAEVEHGILSPAWASQMLGYPPEALAGAVMNSTLVPVGGAPAKEPTQAEKLRIKALKKLVGEKDDEKDQKK